MGCHQSRQQHTNYSHNQSAPKVSSKEQDDDKVTIEESTLERLKRLAELGDVESMYELSEQYEYGDNKDKDERIRWLQRGAEKKHLESMNTLADLYLEPNDKNEYTKLGEAVDLLQQASKLGHHISTAQLASLYLSGMGVPKDPDKAWELYAQLVKVPNHKSVDETYWNEHLQGNLIEDCLTSGAVAMLDSLWLVEYASQPGAKLPYRQDLPANAFLSARDIMKIAGQNYKIPIVMISHMWLQPNHPDPNGTTLNIVAEALKNLMMDGYPTHRYGVFLDFCSLYQHPNAQQNNFRTTRQEVLFQKGLGSLAALFSHPGTKVFRVIDFPPHYPQGYTLPDGSNLAPYENRGWTFTESKWSTLMDGKVRDLVHSNDSVQSLRKYTPQEVPMSPKLFEQAVQQCRFSNGRQDFPLVVQLYQTFFTYHFAQMTQLMLSSQREWMDADCQEFVQCVTGNVCPRLRRLGFGKMQFGTQSCQAFSHAIRVGSFPSLVQLTFYNTDLSDDGVVLMSAALSSLHTLKELNLTKTLVGVRGCQEIAKVVRTNHSLVELTMGVTDSVAAVECCRLLVPALPNLQKLNLNYSKIGNDGLEILIRGLIESRARLEFLHLSDTGIGDLGCTFLAQNLPTCVNAIFMDDNAEIGPDSKRLLLEASERGHNIPHISF